MFYKTLIKDHIMVQPKNFGKEIKEAITGEIKNQYEGFISKDIGIVIDVSSIKSISEGRLIPGSGAAFYETEFYILAFKPEIQEVIMGKIKDMADFGAFITLGPIEGMIHISQTMDDFVSFSKEKTLLGKESKKGLKVLDKCKARLIAISYKDLTNPKFGLTMRQKGIGKIEWIKDDLSPKKGGKNN